MSHWAVVTGEYPPQSGGVADYTRLVATALAGAGDEVTVYAPAHSGADPADPGVSVRRLPGHFGARGLVALDAALSAHPRPDRILVQYTPHAFGWKGMNLLFAAWLAGPGRRIAPVWVMFHEVMFPVESGQPLKHALLGRVTRIMARLIGRTADRAFVSIPAWDRLLRQLGRRASPAVWLPVPSNVPAMADPAQVGAIRARIARETGTRVIGHFGTFGSMNGGLLVAALAAVLRRSSNRIGLLVGRGSVPFLERFLADHPDLVARMTATGPLPAAEASAHLAACDLLLQPYPDGVSTRRGSAMAGLALGVPTVTNTGFLSEPIWGTESVGVTLARSPEPSDLVPAAEAILALPEAERIALGRAAAAWYASTFAADRLIERLRLNPDERNGHA